MRVEGFTRALNDTEVKLEPISFSLYKLTLGILVGRGLSAYSPPPFLTLINLS